MKSDFASGRNFRVIAAGVVLLGLMISTTAQDSANELLRKARLAFNRGDRSEAITLLTEAAKNDPNNTAVRYYRARVYESIRDHAKALADYNHLAVLEPASPQVYQLRGSENFRAGNIKESIADFDKYLELLPDQAPQHWQRGISYYYAGRFQEGRRQFELHQTVNPNDVENAVWHFLCVARAETFEKARAALLPIQGDRRVPMMEVYGLFAGKRSVEDVLAAVQSGNPGGDDLKQRLFYAHLYLGLYFEAMGTTTKANEHIAKAAGPFAVDHYMGDVARVHAQLRRVNGTKQ